MEHSGRPRSRSPTSLIMMLVTLLSDATLDVMTFGELKFCRKKCCKGEFEVVQNDGKRGIITMINICQLLELQVTILNNFPLPVISSMLIICTQLYGFKYFNQILINFNKIYLIHWWDLNRHYHLRAPGRNGKEVMTLHSSEPYNWSLISLVLKEERSLFFFFFL